MNINALNSLSDDLSDSSASSSSGESFFRWDEFHRDILQAGVILGYQFEPRRDSLNNASGESADIEGEENNMLIDEEQPLVRLGNLDW